MTQNSEQADMEELVRYSRMDEFLRDFPGATLENALEARNRTIARAAEATTRMETGLRLVFQETSTSVSGLFQQLGYGYGLDDFHWHNPRTKPEDTHAVLRAAGLALEVRFHRGETAGLEQQETHAPGACPVFQGTSVPLHELFDALLENRTARDFISRPGRPGRDAVQAAISEAHRAFQRLAPDRTRQA